MTIESLLIGVVTGLISSLAGILTAWQLGRVTGAPERCQATVRIAMYAVAALLLLLGIELQAGALQPLVSAASLLGLLAFIAADQWVSSPGFAASLSTLVDQRAGRAR
jgi:hypothetical protein